MKKNLLLGALLLTSLSFAVAPVSAQEYQNNQHRDERGRGHADHGNYDSGRPGPGHADYGRPDGHRPGRPGGRPGWPHRPGPNRPTPGWPGPPNRYYEDTVQISSITRRTGGEWFRLSMRRPVSIEGMTVAALSAGVKIHEAIAHTYGGRRVHIVAFSPSRTIYAGDNVYSSFYDYDRIQAIDIRAESMGGFADILVRVGSTDDYPIMDVRRF